jgi:TRAP-type C4-dicarboxylate transport system permease small subunit
VDIFMEKIEKIFTHILNALVAACLTFMTLFVFSNVVLRYMFNSGITWAEEASRYLFIWLIFLGAIVGLRENAHLGVEIFVKKFSPAKRRWLAMFNYCVIMAIMGLVIHGAFKITLLTWTQSSASIGLPLSFVYLSGLLSAACMVVICSSKIYKIWTYQEDFRGQPIPAPEEGGRE